MFRTNPHSHHVLRPDLFQPHPQQPGDYGRIDIQLALQNALCNSNGQPHQFGFGLRPQCRREFRYMLNRRGQSLQDGLQFRLGGTTPRSLAFTPASLPRFPGLTVLLRVRHGQLGFELR